MYTRNCPSCGKLIRYETRQMYMQAVRRNYKCEQYCHGPHKESEKWCSGCQQYVSKSEFGNSVSHPDGLHDKCKKCARKESQKYYNPERQAAYERENRDKRNKQRKARPNFHKLQREYARIRRALKVGTNEMYTSDDERITLKEFGNKCYRCKSHDHLCIDHHRPLSAGFPLSLTNAVVLCGSCNASKGPKRPEEFYGQKKCRALDKKLKKIGLKYMD